MKKKFNKRFVRVFSRHPSHNIIRKKNSGILWRDLAAVRFGSTTSWKRSRYFLNSPESIENSSSKVRMKQCFERDNVKTARWWDRYRDLRNEQNIPFPIIAKRKYGSRGRGMAKLDNLEQLEAFSEANIVTHYIYEAFHNYSREYRFHVSSAGCFYVCRKVLRRDTPENVRWFRNNQNCNWIRPDGDNPALFDKPVNFEAIEAECVKALNSVGLDFGACDVRVQSSTHSNGDRREYPDFIIVEINSAPSFGEITAEKYKEEIPKILDRKYGRS